MRVGWLLVLVSACFDPTYDAPQCSPRGECPSGFECDLSSNVCESRASGPDSALPVDSAPSDGPASQMDGATASNTLCPGATNAVVCLPFDGDFVNQADGAPQTVASAGSPPMFTTGQVNSALQVASSRFDVSPSFALAGASTIEAFVAPAAPGEDKWIVDQGNRGMFLDEQNRLTCRFGTINLQVTGSLPTNQFTHVACVATTDQIRAYKDGSRAQSIGNTPAASLGVMAIAAKRDGSLPFEGRIDELRVFDIARSDSQVMQAAAR